MFLAEALVKRKKLATEITQLQSVASESVWLDADSEDEKPDLEAIEAIRKEQRDLICAINLTNSSCGMTQLIAQRDFLKAKIKWLSSVSSSASADSGGRYGAKVKRVRNVDVVAVRASLSSAQDELIKLESEINRLNWSIELEE